jgi:hypothetical protein
MDGGASSGPALPRHETVGVKVGLNDAKQVRGGLSPHVGPRAPFSTRALVLEDGRGVDGVELVAEVERVIAHRRSKGSCRRCRSSPLRSREYTR